jgi:hypothetical protein
MYDEFIAAGVAIDHYCSDLYVRDTPANREILYKWKAIEFRQLNWREPTQEEQVRYGDSLRFFCQLDGLMWLDIPFQFKPFWSK